MIKLAHKDLVKPLLVQQGPAGLSSAEPRVWMEGEDLEGFNAHFSYEFIKKPCIFHPEVGALVHPYDECLVFASIDTTDILNLGAEISIELGEEREVHVFTEPTVVVIPKGLQHGPVTVRRVDKTFVHYVVGLAAEYKASTITLESTPSTGSKYGHLIKKYVTRKNTTDTGSGMGYEQVIDERGIMRPAVRGVGAGNADSLLWMYGNDLEGVDVNFLWGHYTRCGKWHRGGEAHTHPEEEILIFVGLDPDNINELGAELEVGMGENCERHIFNKPTVAICPKGFPHLPLITRWVDKPYGFIVICLNGEHDSPWVEA